MYFANPLLLWTLLLGLLPIVIYYLLRYRSLSVTWGANYVLEQALARLKNKLNLDQAILMTLRVLACLLIALAFARPVVRSADAVAAGTGIHHVLVLDTSYSMLAGSPPHRRFDDALAAAKKLVATWGRGEVWSLLLLADQPRFLVDAQPVSTPEETAALLDTLRPTESAASLAVALEQLFQKMPRGKAEVFLFTDDQASTWQLTERLKTPAELEASIYWLNPASTTTDAKPNLAVTALHASADRLLVGNPARITATIRNFSDTKAEDVSVELLIDGSFASRQSVSLLPNQQATVHFDTKFTTPGPHHLCAQLPEDALDFDNRLHAALDVAEQLTVVQLRDPASQGKFDSSWAGIESIERARQLAAQAAGTESTRGQITWKLNEGVCDAASLAQVDVVLLDGSKKLTPALVDTLRAFVHQGGGLLLAADPGVDAAAWNKLLGDAGLLPAQLGRLRSQPLGGDRYRSLARNEITLSPLNIFETDSVGDLTQARFFTAFELESIRPDALALLRFDDQSPWALRAPAGAGRVLQLSTGIAGQGNNLLVREFFVPLLFQLSQDAAAGRIFPRTVARGEPIRLRIADPAAVTGATFSRQGQDAIPLPLRTVNQITAAQLTDASLESGLYSVLTLASPSAAASASADAGRTWFAIQGQRTDSNLAPLSAAQLALISRQLNLTTATDWAQLEQALQKQRAGREWQTWIILAAAAILLGELFFQRRFSPEPPRRARLAAAKGAA